MLHCFPRSLIPFVSSGGIKKPVDQVLQTFLSKNDISFLILKFSIPVLSCAKPLHTIIPELPMATSENCKNNWQNNSNVSPPTWHNTCRRENSPLKISAVSLSCRYFWELCVAKFLSIKPGNSGAMPFYPGLPSDALQLPAWFILNGHLSQPNFRPVCLINHD